jgi:ornithine cyclodeaminase/alanine dehydrogenase-like protein (mu-crystallin family)
MKLLVLSGPEVHGPLSPGACADAMVCESLGLAVEDLAAAALAYRKAAELGAGT